MKILMVNVPFSGHVNPTLQLGKELVKKGHEVSYILNDEWKEQIESTGATYIPYIRNGNFKMEFKNGHPKNIFKALKAWKLAYNTIIEVGKDYDILIYEFFTFVAYSAAKRLGIKVVRQFSTFAINSNNINSILVSDNKEVALMKNKLFLKIITKIICGKIKLSTDNILTEITDVPVNLNIVYTTREFQVNNDEFDDRYCFVGPMISGRICDVKIPYNKMKNSTIIYISLGTLQNEHIDFYEKCIEAFGEKKNISVIMSIGKNINVKSLGNIPNNFYVYNFVPQIEVLERSSIFITHGGMNSVNEGLYFENKLIGIPMDMDQYAVVNRVVELKLGYKISKEEVTVENLIVNVNKLIVDDEVFEHVKNMSSIFRSSGSVSKAVSCIERIF